MSAISIPEVNEAFVIAKCNYFVDTHLWPLSVKLDPQGWLRNFPKEDKVLAIHLLNGFMYFSPFLLDQLFISAFRGLSRTIVDQSATPSQRRNEWKKFLDEVVVTYPTGETPSNADSGHLFVRRARDLLGIPESRIMSPDHALEELLRRSIKRVVFVDDFVGSGQQFILTWHRPVDKLGKKTFASDAPVDSELYYVPMFCTRFALDNALSSVAGRIHICPAHVITSEYGALSDPSLFWPNSLKTRVRDFIYRTSMAIGLPDSNGLQANDWQGFCKLGLGIAFEHQIPDASLPMFYSTNNGWTPLWRKQP